MVSCTVLMVVTMSSLHHLSDQNRREGGWGGGGRIMRVTWYRIIRQCHINLSPFSHCLISTLGDGGDGEKRESRVKGGRGEGRANERDGGLLYLLCISVIKVIITTRDTNSNSSNNNNKHTRNAKKGNRRKGFLCYATVVDVATRMGVLLPWRRRRRRRRSFSHSFIYVANWKQTNLRKKERKRPTEEEDS